MAGDWLKVEHSTPEKPEMFAIAATLGIDPDQAFGICFRMWRWFDQHTADGNAVSVTKALLDRHLGVTGFADACVSVGWLNVTPSGLSLPNFSRHNGQTSKARALTYSRVQAHRGKVKRDCNAPSVTESLPETETETETETKENTSMSVCTDEHNANGNGNGKPDAPAALMRLIELWNKIPDIQHCRDATRKRVHAFRQRSKDDAWMQSVRPALERVSRSSFCRGRGKDGWIADIDWFLRPDTVTRIIEGKYDDRSQPTRVQSVPEAPPGGRVVYNAETGEIVIAKE